VIYSGGDDVMAVLPLEDLPEYLLSLRSAWCGQKEPYGDRDPDVKFIERGGYWQPTAKQGDRQGLPDRPLFTMGEGATMSFGIVIAYKSVPLPVVLNALWEAEKERAKKMRGTGEIPSKDGLCFRVLYGSGNCLEALMKGHLLDGWWRFVNTERRKELGSLLYRLSEELPRHAAITPDHQLVARAAGAIANRRDDRDALDTLPQLIEWLERWETWAYGVEEAWTRSQQTEPGESYPLGITLAELADLLRFTAFWLDKMEQRVNWLNSEAR
jgi:CRISPR-associated protein Cmr2